MHPVHVVLRTRVAVPRLRQRCMYRAICGVLLRCLGRADVRIVHVSIQHNHLHLLVEAQDARALARGMQSFAIRAARAINRAWGRIGAVFGHRYHATQIHTLRHARGAIVYVLNNWRRHREDLVDPATRQARLDPYASGLAFAGWTERFACPTTYAPLPVAPPRTHLLRAIGGGIDPFEVPGPPWR